MKSAQELPPCPSKTPKNEIFGIAFDLSPLYGIRLRVIVILSSL
jgi:hypothetical protein